MGGEVVDQMEYEQYELHSTRTTQTEAQSIFVAAFKTDIPQVLGGSKGIRTRFENKYPLGALKTDKIWDTGDGYSGVSPQISASLENQKGKLDMAENTALGEHQTRVCTP